MTKPSPITWGLISIKSDNKGSTYGKAISSSNSHSFQGSPGNGGLDNQDRIQVLYAQVALCSSQSRSIIKLNEFTRGPKNT